jgi:pimeloyl-ACP methyl ester carboxylesterase
MKAIFHPEPVPPDRVERELALFARRPELLLSMVHVARGRPCEQLLSLASDIQCPVLFLHGQDDALVPAGCAKSIHDRIVMAGGCSRFQLLPGAGHMLIDYQATDVKNSIAQFLSP